MTHKNVSLSGTERLDTFVGVLAWELFVYHYILAPALVVVALLLNFFRVRGSHSPRFLAVCVCTYLVCHVGVLIGAHRCLSHHACQFTQHGRYLFAFLTSIAVQGPARSWAFLHRVHHRFCEQELDIHTPTPPHDFFWAQGLFYTSDQTLAQMNVHNFHFVSPDMEDEDAMIADGWPAEMVKPDRLIAKHLQILAGFALLAFCFESLRQALQAGYLNRCLPSRTLVRVSRLEDADNLLSSAALSAGGCCGTVCRSAVFAFNAVAFYFWLPMVLSMQITMLVNSAVHIWGDEPYQDAMSDPCRSKNNAFLFWPMLGENWHNNHHGAPGSATTWVNWYQFDCQYLVMRLLERTGFVELVRTQPPSRAMPGYEMISFASILASWLEMAIVMATPFVLAKLAARYEQTRSTKATPTDASDGMATTTKGVRELRAEAAIEAVPLTKATSAPPSPTLDAVPA